MTVEADQIKDINQQLKNMIEKVPQQIKRLQLELSLCDKERTDILHLIELSNFNASEGYRLSKDIQITQRKRREIKDELELLNQIQNGTKTHRSLAHQTAAVDKIFRQRGKFISKRVYTPRVRKDLTEKFKIAKGVL